MSDLIGRTLDHYEVVELIGAGGMGEVYRAQDTRLDRVVAIKVLPAGLSADEDSRARFEREARAVSKLSHPNICTLYDVGEHEGAPFLVMEHLEGETLKARLRSVEGEGLPMGDVLEIGAQVADALAAAHRHGVLHRDLKPANIMLASSGARLLDFGLAKLTGHGQQNAWVDPEAAPTPTDPLTGQGVVLGTWPYMAPEQLQGKQADTRTDLWALGCVLYEMITGRRAFKGEDRASLITAIMAADPPALSQVQPMTPPSLQRLVRRCLTKSGDDRWESAHDLAYELRGIAESAGAAPATQLGAASPRGFRRPFVWAAASAVIAASITATVMSRLRGDDPPRPLPVVRSLLDVSPADELNAGYVSRTTHITPGGSRTALAWTPAGRSLVFVGRRDGVQQLYVRALDEPVARPLAGTEGAQVPTVSADGRSVAFWSDGAIRQVPLAGGPTSILVPDRTYPPTGMAWGVSGKLLIGGRTIGVATDGEYTRVTTRAEDETRHVLPQWLPGDGAFLFTVRDRLWTWGGERLVVQNFATGERTVLLRDAVDARYAAGNLVFMRTGTLYAVRFDPARLEVQGEPVAVLSGVAQALAGGHSRDLSGAGHLAVAPTGSLAYVEGPLPSFPGRRLLAVGRNGLVTPLALPEGSYMPWIRASRDGNRVAVANTTLSERALWIGDLSRGVLTRPPGSGEVPQALWAPDSERLVLLQLHEGAFRLATLPGDCSAPPEHLGEPVFPASWSARRGEIVGVWGGDLWAVTAEGGAERRRRPVLQSPATENWPALSPDGRWLAYGSDASGRFEVYLQPYPGPGPRTQVSSAGGSCPAWNPQGGELFFLAPGEAPGETRMMAVEITIEPQLRVGQPRSLFEVAQEELSFYCVPLRCYDVAPDGQSFFVTQAAFQEPTPPVTHIHLVLNWLEEVKARLAAAPPS